MKPLKVRLGRYHKLTQGVRFARYFQISAVILLLISAMAWSVWGAVLQQQNADELADPHLFTGSTFSQATFPTQHTMLLKWPLFWLIRLCGYSRLVTVLLAVTVSMASVVGIMWLLRRLERRPLQFGVLCLTLASLLSVIPAQPYATGLLPVNMAMLATRNIEYLVYLSAIVLTVQAQRLRSYRSLAAIGLLGVLAASDRLFIIMGLGAAVLMVVIYGFYQQWKLVTLAIRWLVICTAAYAVSMVLLIGLAHLTAGVPAAAGGTSPFTTVGGGREGLVAAFFSVSGLFTNLGANPGYAAATIRQFPLTGLRELLGLGLITYLVNISAALGATTITGRLVSASLQRGKPWFTRLGVANQTFLILLTSALTMTAVFIGTDHYYRVDSRYLTVWLLVAIVSLAIWLRKQSWRSENLAAIGLLLAISTLLGTLHAGQINHRQSVALNPIKTRNAVVAEDLHQHHTLVLAGDYWRVYPIINNQLIKNKVTPLPLSDCTTPRQVLASNRWVQQARHGRVAYLVSLDKGVTDFPACSLQTVVERYGQPSGSQVVVATGSQPREVLLYYNHGLQLGVVPHNGVQKPADAKRLSDLAAASCPRTDMNIVAHQDDDLLFMNPDIIQALQAGDCVRSVYLTAGDAGHGASYWQDREYGAQAAYAMMLKVPNIWQRYSVTLPAGQIVTVAMPQITPKVSLIFMHLPDGDLDGQGFAASHNQALTKLYYGDLTSLRTVDKQSTYNAEQLSLSLTELMRTYQPGIIRTQSSQQGSVLRDHSDHAAAGLFAAQAFNYYLALSPLTSTPPQLHYYEGYPIRELAPNLSQQQRIQKLDTFLTYAAHDGGVCQSSADCAQSPAYGAYLQRQYQASN